MVTPRNCLWLCVLAMYFLDITEANNHREDALIGYSEKEVSTIVLDTSFGKAVWAQIAIKVHTHATPETAKLVLDLARGLAACKDCRFYRNEMAPESGLGPPYGLLQGSLAGLTAAPPLEGKKVTKRGDVCMIPNTKEFFIAVTDHDEWGTAHTVWGEVDDASMAVVHRICMEPFHKFTHPEFGTVMRLLNHEEHFNIDIGKLGVEL